MDISLVEGMIAAKGLVRDCDISVLLEVDLTTDVSKNPPKGYTIPKEHLDNITFGKDEELVCIQNGGPELVQAVKSQKEWSNKVYFYYRPTHVYFYSA